MNKGTLINGFSTNSNFTNCTLTNGIQPNAVYYIIRLFDKSTFTNGHFTNFTNGTFGNDICYHTFQISIIYFQNL